MIDSARDRALKLVSMYLKRNFQSLGVSSPILSITNGEVIVSAESPLELFQTPEELF